MDPAERDVGLPPLVCSLWNRKCSCYRKQLTFSKMVVRQWNPVTIFECQKESKCDVFGGCMCKYYQEVVQQQLKTGLLASHRTDNEPPESARITCSPAVSRRTGSQLTSVVGSKHSGRGAFCVTVEKDWRYDTLSSSMTSGCHAGGKTGDLFTHGGKRQGLLTYESTPPACVQAAISQTSAHLR